MKRLFIQLIIAIIGCIVIGEILKLIFPAFYAGYFTGVIVLGIVICAGEIYDFLKDNL